MFNRKQFIVLLCSTTLFSTALFAAQPLDDPMRPPGEIASISGKKTVKPIGKNGNGFYLNAIRITKDQRSASINGKTVSLGEYIGAARVVTIHASSVTLLQAGKLITISLLPLSIKKPVEAIKP